MDSISPEQRLYTALAAIPPGYVVTYGQLASLSGWPRRARWVGQQLKRLPTGTTLPWHRVINAAGKISFPVGSDKAHEQAKRLRQDGVEVVHGKVSLAKYQWPG
ncbi:cysteine methyltransferase [Bacterioplanes sanyensis]|uniref:Cysteine methyltransferase n=2 Tax=Bacterioplanes sanyensis TaxID=1249553 RepID=A0A222FPF7_9GAMM|nr:cysteine methyltransferase [Bacterioplanes sanyensis]